jgi:cysteinyl-tRNA synthetase
LFILIGECNIALASGDLQGDNRAEILDLIRTIDQRLAIIPPMEHGVLDEKTAGEDQEIAALVQKRNEARTNRDFALSDQIRQQLLERGIVIEDTREGTKWRRK